MTKTQIVNGLTIARVVLCAISWFMMTSPGVFLLLFYSACLSDVLDGWLARHWQVTSEKGARLDSRADLVLYLTLTVYILPALSVPAFIWIGCILVIKGMSLFLGYRYNGQGVALHTWQNKSAGIAAVLYPLFLNTPLRLVWLGLSVILLTYSSLHELKLVIDHKTLVE